MKRCVGSRVRGWVGLWAAGLTIASAAGVDREIELRLPEADVRITVLLSLPKGRGEHPLCVLLPGGAGLRDQAELTVRALADPLTARGWIVAVPMSPFGVEFFRPERVSLVPELVAKLKARRNVAPDRTLIGGLSNGGGGALLVAGLNPGWFDAAIIAPGFFLPESEQARAVASADRLNAGLKGLPVLLRTGAQDELGWARGAHQESVKALRSAGALVDERIVEGAGHVLQLKDEELKVFLDTVYGEEEPNGARIP